ncbi:hypothetical protein LPTSP4_17440 [Leptospira ryugenii]|uniref:Lcl C-terminal domain-containing protein n=1 Tax=Leptospira ryugenii TaxID=1917863 RepID=A0A2P2E023_9LEPT|nr:DUF1566 domain-containing protein [Leptospira ryugenii]GBF50220.1 hypothetical protein LPTSP4_17440 [Leptospira ryugenii]
MSLIKLFQSVSILLPLLLLLNCEAKPVEDNFGLSPEDFNVLLLGLASNVQLRDTGTGTIIDTAAGLEWRKCSVGQVFRQANNDCLGAPAGSALNPQDPFKYGARQLAFCDSRTHACNRVAAPQTLVATSEIAIQGTSELYAACASLGSGYRVPNPFELQRLTAGGRNLLLVNFPSTVEGDYWSGWSEVTDFEGTTAIAVSFDRESFGQEKRIVKTDRNYVRCVKNYP